MELAPNTGLRDQNDDPEELVNLVEEFNEEDRKKLTKAVIDGFNTDVTSRGARMKRERKWQKLYSSDIESKTAPFQNAANINAPLMTNALQQVASRLWDMLFPSTGDICHTMASNIGNIERAQATERYFNSFLRYELPDYALSWYDTIHQACKAGSAFRRSYYDPSEKRIKVDRLGMDSVVVAYSEKVIDPSMRGVPRYTIRLRMTDQQIRRYLDDDTWIESDKKPITLKETDEADEQKSDAERGADRIDGVEQPNDEDPTIRRRSVLEQYLWWKLPKKKNVPGFDGGYHAVIAWVHVATRQLLRVIVREEDDPKDKKRYERQMAHRSVQMMALAQRQMQGMQGMGEMGGMPPLSGEEGEPPGLPEEAEPPLEEALETPEPPQRREITFMTHVRAFHADGFYGMGFGDMLGSLNVGLNTLLNQGIDATTVDIAGGGWYSSQLRMPAGTVSFTPGEYQRVEAPAALMQDGIIHRKPVGLNPALMQIAGLIKTMGEQATSTGEVMSGEKAAANETATTTQIRAEMAMKQVTVLARLIIEAMKCELLSLWRLLSLFLDEEEAQRIVNDDGSVTQYQLKREDFVVDALVAPTADPRVSSNAELVGRAQNLLASVTQNPLTATVPAMLRAATAEYLSALGFRGMTQLLPPAPPSPPPPPPPRPQWEENAGFLNEQDSPVNPDDDDEAHLHEMGLFHGDPMGGQQLSPTGRKMYERHARAHMAQKLVKERRADHAQGAEPQAAPTAAPAV